MLPPKFDLDINLAEKDFLNTDITDHTDFFKYFVSSQKIGEKSNFFGNFSPVSPGIWKSSTSFPRIIEMIQYFNEISYLLNNSGSWGVHKCAAHTYEPPSSIFFFDY